MDDTERDRKLKILSERKEVTLIARALGVDADLHLVGGVVRDALLGRETHDIDLATALQPAEVVSRLERAGIRVIPTGLQHQTVTAVPVPDAGNVEITTFRAPGISTEKRVVASDSIEVDLKLRDFTLNALAFSLLDSRIVDCVDGIRDLKARILRGVISPEDRFREDPLRVLRMVRFAATLDLDIDPATFDAALVVSPLLKSVSIERVREELNCILLSTGVSLALRRVQQLGVFNLVIPELERCVGFEQNRFHTADVFEHTIAVIEKTESDLVLRLGALLHDIAKPPTLTVDADGERHFYRHEVLGEEIAREVLTRLKYSNEIIDSVCLLVRTHMRPIDAGMGGLRRLLRDTGEQFDRWRKLKEADSLSTKIDVDEARLKLTKFDEQMVEIRKGPAVHPLSSLAIKGRDLVEMGVSPGPHIGELLRALHERVLDNPELNTADCLLALTKELAPKFGVKIDT